MCLTRRKPLSLSTVAAAAAAEVEEVEEVLGAAAAIMMAATVVGMLPIFGQRLGCQLYVSCSNGVP